MSAVDGGLFWGADSLEFVKAFVADPGMLASEAMRRVGALPLGAQRDG